MAVYSISIAWAHERENYTNQQLWWSRQYKESGASIYFSIGLSAVHLNISFSIQVQERCQNWLD